MGRAFNIVIPKDMDLRTSVNSFLRDYAPDKERYDKTMSFIDIGIYFIPLVGDIRDLVECITGVNLVSGEKLSTYERIMALVGVFLPIIGGAVLCKLFKYGKKIFSKLDDIGKLILKSFDNIAPKIVKNIDNVVGFIAKNYDRLVDTFYKYLDKFKSIAKNIKISVTKTIDDVVERATKNVLSFFRNVAITLDDFLSEALVVPSINNNGTVALNRVSFFEDIVDNLEDDFKNIVGKDKTSKKSKVEKLTNSQKVENLLGSLNADNIARDMSWKDFSTYVDTKGKYSKSVKAIAYYKYTGKGDKINKIDFGKYLEEYKPKPEAKKSDRLHAHHILYKKGKGEAQQRLAEEGAELLRKYNINPILDPDNLVWARNKAGQHTEENLRQVVETLKREENMAIARYGEEEVELIEQKIRKKLIELGKVAAKRK